MEDVNFSLPEPLKAFVDDQVADGQYDSTADYMIDLIRADEKRKAVAKLDSMLLEGFGSEATPWLPSDLDRLRALAATGR